MRYASGNIDDLNRIKKADIYEKTRVIRDYEKTKPRLFIRLLNADKYSADLQDAVYKTLGDIALVLYMKVTEYEGCVTSTKIRQGMLEQWGKESAEQNNVVIPRSEATWESVLLHSAVESGVSPALIKSGRDIVILPLLVDVDIRLVLDKSCDFLGALLTGEEGRGLLLDYIIDARGIVGYLGGGSDKLPELVRLLLRGGV